MYVFSYTYVHERGTPFTVGLHFKLYNVHLLKSYILYRSISLREKDQQCHQLLAVGRFPPGTSVSSTRKLISSLSFHRLDMTLAEALTPNKLNQQCLQCRVKRRHPPFKNSWLRARIHLTELCLGLPHAGLTLGLCLWGHVSLTSCDRRLISPQGRGANFVLVAIGSQTQTTFAQIRTESSWFTRTSDISRLRGGESDVGSDCVAASARIISGRVAFIIIHPSF